MTTCLSRIEGLSWFSVRVSVLVVGVLVFACAEGPPRSTLPPSASDLVLLKSARLCDSKATFLQRHQGVPLRRDMWGSGEELRVPANRSESGAEESYFFDQDGLLVGMLFVFPNGHGLKPYPVLRKTLSELKPVLEFYLSNVRIPGRENLDTSALYHTGDEKSTHQYLTLGEGNSSALLLASFSIDPYVNLLSPYRQEFLARLGQSDREKSSQRSGGQGAEDKERFPSLQQFARGETAQLSYCGAPNYDIAVEAYGNAIAHGFTNKVQLSEAHHKLGLALEKKGQLERARDEMQQSVTIHPNRPDVLNNLGNVYKKLGDRRKAIAAFEKSVTLRPNYAIARYNLADAYELDNPKLAISEYETYLALVEGIPEEAERAARARERVNALKR